MKHVLALDQGTTSSRAIVFDEDGRIVATAPAGVPPDLPAARLGRARPAGDLGDADRRRGRGAEPGAGSGRGTSRRSASPTSARRRSSGTARPASRSATRSSGRTGARRPFCDRLKADGHEPTDPRAHRPRASTPTSPAPRSAWILDNVPGARARGRGGRAGLRHHRHLARLASSPSGTLHVTDASNASRTMLFNIHTRRVGRRAAAAASACPARMLPEVRASSEVYGEVSTTLGPRGRADRRASPATSRRPSSARCASTPGLTKNTYGTGCFMLQNTGDTSRSPRAHRLLTTVAWNRRRAAPSTPSKAASSSAARSCSGCATASASSAPRPTSRRSPPRSPTTAASTSCPPSPASGAPHWDPYARGTHRRASPAARRAGHIARAALESIAFQVADLLEAMQRDAGIALAELRVDGGASQQRPAHAVPGRPARRPGRAARGHRDHGPRRGLPGRAGGRASGTTSRTHRRPVAGRPPLRAGDAGRARPRPACALARSARAREGLGRRLRCRSERIAGRAR